MYKFTNITGRTFVLKFQAYYLLKTLKFHLLFICAYVCMSVCRSLHMGLLYPVYLMQVVSLGSKHPYFLSHLTYILLVFLKQGLDSSGQPQSFSICQDLILSVRSYTDCTCTRTKVGAGEPNNMNSVPRTCVKIKRIDPTVLYSDLHTCTVTLTTDTYTHTLTSYTCTIITKERKEKKVWFMQTKR